MADTDLTTRARAVLADKRFTISMRRAIKRGYLDGGVSRRPTIEGMRRRGLIRGASWSFSRQEWTWITEDLDREVTRLLAEESEAR